MRRATIIAGARRDLPELLSLFSHLRVANLPPGGSGGFPWHYTRAGGTMRRFVPLLLASGFAMTREADAQRSKLLQGQHELLDAAGEPVEAPDDRHLEAP